MKNTRINIFFLLIILVMTSGLIRNPAQAQGDLMITPGRVVFNGIQKRTQMLNLANSGADTSRYVISILEYRMTEEGQFELITEPDSGQMFASPFVRFFPRSVTLPPYESQVIRIQLYNTHNMEEGEHRSHIYFRAVEEQNPLGSPEEKVDSSSFSVKLKAVYGITIPLIIRNGEVSSEATINSPKFFWHNDTIPGVEIMLERSGNASVYGDITVIHTSPSGKETQVGIAKGVAVYTPNQKRKFVIRLLNDGVNLNKGKLDINYSTQATINADLIAKTEIILSNQK